MFFFAVILSKYSSTIHTFPCGHERSIENTYHHTSKGKSYQRCKCCRTKRARERRHAEQTRKNPYLAAKYQLEKTPLEGELRAKLRGLAADILVASKENPKGLSHVVYESLKCALFLRG